LFNNKSSAILQNFIRLWNHGNTTLIKKLDQMFDIRYNRIHYKTF